MQKNISVVTCEGKFMESTYPKRAKQLVKQNKAEWIDDSTICLLGNEMECVSMEYNSNGPRTEHDTEARGLVGAVPVYESMYTDEELYKMAKKRVKERAELIIHVIAYITVNIFVGFIAMIDGDLWNFYLIGGWGIGLACHVASYFFSSTPDRIHNEYLKQKSKYRV